MRPAPAPVASGPFPFAGPATFVTADSPLGRIVADEENAARRNGLATFLGASGFVWHPAVGGDPDGIHLEPGAVVLGLDLPSATALGAHFEQAAVYVWTVEALHLVACAEDRHDILGYRSRPGTRLSLPTTPGPGSGKS